jgi:Rod binding domain-containing protein
MRLDNETRNLSMSPYRSQTSSAPESTPDSRAEQLTKASRGFEGFMLGELLKTMRNAEGADRGIIRTSRAERIFINQQCEVLGNLLAEGEPLGLGRLLSSQAAAAPPATEAPAMRSLHRKGGSHAADTH